MGSNPRCLLVVLALLAGPLLAQPPADTDTVKHFRVRSRLLTEFWGKETHLEAGVVIPPDREVGERLPICISVHGFGGSHVAAWSWGPRLVESMKTADYPRMLYVYPDANNKHGHHVFADSANNGPCGRALIDEFLPAIEKAFQAGGSRDARFLTGHSSGGWSVLWLQIHHPEVFGGAWASAPDPVDFRRLGGIDLYAFTNGFSDPEGREIGAVRKAGQFVLTNRQAVKMPQYVAQARSLESVFSPRGEDGDPLPFMNLETGEIARDVVKAWRSYDIRLFIKNNWTRLKPLISGRLNIFVGTDDDFRADEPVRLLAEELDELGCDATIVLAEGRDHFNLFQPEPRHWPEGMITRIHREMRRSFEKARR